MIDTAMLRRLLTQCGMENFVIDAAALRVARAIWTAAQAEEREACAKLCENSDRYRGEYFAAKIRER